MNNQLTFTDLEYSSRKRTTRREEFLDTMDSIIPWDEFVELIRPYYYKNRTGRPSNDIETMLRMYLLASWFTLSDEGVEDAIYDSYALRKFMGVDFNEHKVPDATTLCKFRKILTDNKIDKLFADTCNNFLEKHGYMMRGGTIVDATIITAPSSTKNAEKKRDPEMKSTKKGNVCYYGAKMHAGVDAESGMIHTVETTAANVHDSQPALDLLRDDDEVMYGDSAYSGVSKQERAKQDPHFSRIEYRTNSQKPYRKNKWEEGPGTYWHCQMEAQKSRVRYKVEYAFYVIKNIFGFRKTRYRGLNKLDTHLRMLAVSANFYMASRSTLCELPISVEG